MIEVEVIKDVIIRAKLFKKGDVTIITKRDLLKFRDYVIKKVKTKEDGEGDTQPS